MTNKPGCYICDEPNAEQRGDDKDSEITILCDDCLPGFAKFFPELVDPVEDETERS